MEAVMFQWLTFQSVCNVHVIWICQNCGIAKSVASHLPVSAACRVYRSVLMWAHHPAALSSWTARHSTENLTCLCCSLSVCLLEEAPSFSWPHHRDSEACVPLAAADLQCLCKTSFSFPHDVSRHRGGVFFIHKHSKSHCLYTLPKDDYSNPYLDWRLHVEFSAGDDSLLLVSRRQRSWMLLLSEIPEQENMPNFPKWAHYHYLVH